MSAAIDGAPRHDVSYDTAQLSIAQRGYVSLGRTAHNIAQYVLTHSTYH